MKNLKILALILIVSSYVSCGKKNDVNANQANPNPVQASPAPVIGSSAAKTELVNIINANTFFNLTYNYIKMKTVAGQSDCKRKWTIFYVCSGGSGNNKSMSYLQSGQSITNNEFGTTFATVQSALRDKVNQAVEVKNYGNGKYGIRMSNNDIYYFNQNLALVFNPVQKITNNGSGYTIF